MARKKKLSACALNIIIHDEEKRDYKKLLKMCGSLHEVIPFNRTHAACMVGTRDIVTAEGEFLFGTIYRFIDVKPPYFNTKELAVIIDDEGNPKDVLSPQIKSNTLEVMFCLFEDVHRIFVDTRNIKPKMIKDFFEKIFSYKYIIDEFGQVDVSLHSTKEGIDEILQMYSLRYLDIIVHRPNPTGLNRYDFDVEESLKEQNSELLQHKLATRKGDLSPNDLTKNFMHAARNHGRVIGKGRDDEGKIVTLDTDESPLTDSIMITTDDIYTNALARLSKKIWNTIIRNNSGE